MSLKINSPTQFELENTKTTNKIARSKLMWKQREKTDEPGLCLLGVTVGSSICFTFGHCFDR
jgi:hypothetical protein